MHFSPDVPYLLVGTKLDLRNDPSTLEKLKVSGSSPITTQKGEDLAKRIKAVKYLECSAKTEENLKMVFDEAVKSVLFNSKRKKRGMCIVL
mmetsp:Transcript_22510/g.25083  ORF Transcript_22510/g.25083 Transcript_22510/m.25083 type:complete len:91 (-) Transcript_22510:94-366(-)